MNEFIQKRLLQTLTFELEDSGLRITERKTLGTKQHYISYFDLGIDVIKESDRQGLPTILIIGFMYFPTLYGAINNMGKNWFLALFLLIASLVYILVILYSFQEYYKKTYKIVGSPQELVLFQDNPSSRQTITFLEQIRDKVKRAQVIKYNDLIQMFSNNEKVTFHSLDENKPITDQQYRLLKDKVGLITRNLDLGYSDWDEEDEEINQKE